MEVLDQFRHRIPRDETRGMRTDVIVYASRHLIEQIQKDQSLEQAKNVATLPGIVGPSLGWPRPAARASRPHAPGHRSSE
jgi:tRNA-splicing ligase RtcB